MWFTASLLFKSRHQPTANEDPLWEEEIVLLEAEDEAMAKRKAMEHGEKEEHEYRNQAGLVHWSFERVERLYQIEESVLKNGTELFSRFLRDSEVKSILTPFEE